MSNDHVDQTLFDVVRRVAGILLLLVLRCIVLYCILRRLRLDLKILAFLFGYFKIFSAASDILHLALSLTGRQDAQSFRHGQHQRP
jgi:hypothetical protein